jgi:hypothetical protein
MACPEINAMHEQVKGRLDHTLTNWHQALQFRYGDPRVYEMQQEAMQRQQMGVVYEAARREDKSLLQDAYQQRAAKNRETHTARMEVLKRQNYRASGTPPQSGAAADPPRKPGRPRKHPAVAD